MTDQAEVDRWAALVAHAYAEACSPPLSIAEEVQLARTLDGPVAADVMLGEAPSAREVDPTLDRWERGQRRRSGPRLELVDYGRGLVTMRI